MTHLLIWLSELTASYATGIILLTLLLKIIFFPLQKASARESLKLQNLNGEKPKDLKPLPLIASLLLQTPVWIWLYHSISDLSRIMNESWLWIPSLASADPIFLLPALSGFLLFFQLKKSPKALRLAIPTLMTVISSTLPAAVSLYFFVNSSAQFIQQTLLEKMI